MNEGFEIRELILFVGANHSALYLSSVPLFASIFAKGKGFPLRSGLARNGGFHNVVIFVSIMSICILPTSYLGPIQQYSKLKVYENCLVEHFEHFPKQTYRSRCEIYSPNGKLTLSVPLIKRNERQATKDVRIAYEYDWQTLHWRSLESCYRRSPFFEYFEDDFRPFYDGKKTEFLVDLNEELQQLILSLMKLKANYSFSSEYHKNYPEATDLRDIISPKSNPHTDKDFHPIPYMQVFETRHGFLPNLSIVDLLFNQGSRAQEYI